jgi:hypothetical protein
VLSRIWWVGDGDALPGDDKVVGLKLLHQRLIGAALGTVREARRFGGRDGHTRGIAIP